MAMLRRARSYLVDHPSAVTLAIFILVLAHLIVATWISQVAPPALFVNVAAKALPAAVSSLAVGVASVAAMVGGFAGVVVVFGLSSDDERFRQVRLKASTSLRRNWMSVVTTPLFAAFGSMLAATLATAGFIPAALWLLELCTLLAAHGALRLVVLLSELVRVVHAADEAQKTQDDEIDTDEFLGG